MLTALSLASSLWVLSHGAGERAVRLSDGKTCVERPSMICYGTGETSVCSIPDGPGLDCSQAALIGGDTSVARDIFVARDDGKPFVPVEKVADDFGRDLYWLIGSHALDLYTTAWAIHRCPGCAEGNFLGPTAEARIALKMASVASTGLTVWKLRRDGHARAATIVRWVSVAANAVFITNNAIHIARRR